MLYSAYRRMPPFTTAISDAEAYGTYCPVYHHSYPYAENPDAEDFAEHYAEQYSEYPH